MPPQKDCLVHEEIYKPWNEGEPTSIMPALGASCRKEVGVIPTQQGVQPPSSGLGRTATLSSGIPLPPDGRGATGPGLTQWRR